MSFFGVPPLSNTGMSGLCALNPVLRRAVLAFRKGRRSGSSVAIHQNIRMRQDLSHEHLSAVEVLLASGADQTQLLDAYSAGVDAAMASTDEAEISLAIEQGARVAAACTGWHLSWTHYCVSNAWSELFQARRSTRAALSWDQPELLHVILELRRAILSDGFSAMHFRRRAQVHCNLGNALSAAGRTIDAIEQWEEAMKANPLLAMAHGNLGEGLEFYARNLYDGGHQVYLLQRARLHLESALEIGLGRDGATYPEALDHFRIYLDRVNRLLHNARAPALVDEARMRSFSMGRSKREKLYRKWCLERKLFLNPMNDVFAEPIAAHDVLSLPDHRADGVGIKFLAFFNQMKQEYAYARWCLFEGLSARDLHYADKEVKLVFNADHARYSIAIEQVKTSFRAAYSLLDKVAYFVHEYWRLPTEKSGVSFSSMWTVPGKKGQRVVRPELERSMNIFLQALFWIARDVFKEDFQQVASPDTQALNDLRNHLEHKFLKVVDVKSNDLTDLKFADTLSHEITLEELTQKTERMLKKSRSALIYLCLAMHRAEQSRPRDESLVMSLPTMNLPDSLKR